MAQLKLPAQLTKTNVMNCLQQFLNLGAQHKAVEVECSAITTIDSAGIALLLEFKYSKSVATTLSGVTPAITALAQLYHVSLD
jgi:ABC-type transporter Mla MlaB component